MQLNALAAISEFSPLLFVYLNVLLWIAAGIYVLILATRFVRTHERAAAALEAIARKLSNGGKLSS